MLMLARSCREPEQGASISPTSAQQAKPEDLLLGCLIGVAGLFLLQLSSHSIQVISKLFRIGESGACQTFALHGIWNVIPSWDGKAKSGPMASLRTPSHLARWIMTQKKKRDCKLAAGCCFFSVSLLSQFSRHHCSDRNCREAEPGCVENDSNVEDIREYLLKRQQRLPNLLQRRRAPRA